MKRHPFARALVLAGLLAAAGCGGGGGGGSSQPAPDPLRSTFTASVPFGTPAGGVEVVELAVQLFDAAGNPLPGLRVVLECSGAGNQIVQPPLSDVDGRARGTLGSLVGERKTITAVVEPGPNEVRLGPVTTEFLRIRPNDRFVRTNGSDANSGRTPLAAWRSPAHALAQAPAGATVYVGAGTYPEALAIASSDLELVGDRAGEFTGDPGEVVIDAGMATSALELGAVSDVLVRGLTLRGAAPGGLAGGGIRVAGATDCAIVECLVLENERGVDVANASGIVLEANRITDNFGPGVVLAATADCTLVGNLIYANAAEGVRLATPSTNLRIELNTLFQNGGDQVREASAGGTGVIANNVLTEGGAQGLVLASGSGYAPNNNLSWAQLGPNPPGNLEADPLFVDPDGADDLLGGIGGDDDDFRFELASPTLDAGLGSARETLLPFRGPASALTSRADRVRDGRSPDAPAVNMGFHYPVALDQFASLGTHDARVAFGLPGDVRLWTRAWEGAGGTFTVARAAQTANSDAFWVVQRASPTVVPEEAVAVLSRSGVRNQLHVRTWDGRRWDDARLAPFEIDVADANERNFDLEYEELSGDLLLVRSTGGANPLFSVLDEGTWSAEAPVFAPALATGKILWVELVPRAGSDEIALVALDNQSKLVAAIWDGAQWTSPLLVATQVNAVQDWKAFDAAWESASGDLLVAWGYSAIIEETRFATFDHDTRAWLTNQFNSTDAVGALLSLASDPTSDRIAAVFGEGDFDDDVCVSVWNGTQWTETAEFALLGQPAGRALEIGWIGRTGQAFAIYRDQALAGAFQWGLLTSGGWRRQTEVALPGVGKIARAETRDLPDQDRVLMLLLDEAGALFAVEYDGTAWRLRHGGQPLATGLDTAAKGRAFDLDFRRM